MESAYLAELYKKLIEEDVIFWQLWQYVALNFLCPINLFLGKKIDEAFLKTQKIFRTSYFMYYIALIFLFPCRRRPTS